MPDAAGLRVAILGAGAIGCYVGGRWLAAGLDVRFIGRERVAREISEHGMTLSDHAGRSWRHRAGDVRFETTGEALADADLIVLAVKCTALAGAIAEIAQSTGPEVPVLSLLNGVRPVVMLRDALPDREIIAGMVPFNVARLGPGRWHQGSKGDVTVARTTLTERLADCGAALELVGDMTPVLWAKLLLNLNNPVNALSGKTLYEELSKRGYRRVFAASMREALAILQGAGIRPANVTALPARALPAMLETPDWFFRRVGLPLQKIDRVARSSMADDLARGVPSEIDFLNGEIVDLAMQTGASAPVNVRIVALVKTAEEKGLTPFGADALAAAVLE